jgi:hypothetical protein
LRARSSFSCFQSGCGRVRSPHAGDSIDRPGIGKRASRLTPLVAEVTPPAYSGEHAFAIDEPNDIRALTGSVLTLRGRGDGGGVIARVGSDSIAATTKGDRWSITLRLPTRPAALRLADGTYERIVAVEPIADDPPSVTLMAPVHDSVLRVAKGRIGLSADVSVQLRHRQRIVRVHRAPEKARPSGFARNARAARLNTKRTIDRSDRCARLVVAQSGDIVHLRAVARDANTVSGPGVGVSDTRAIRIARADEYDSVAVDAAPPSDADKSVISERMLIMLAEALEKKRPTLKRDAPRGRVALDRRRSESYAAPSARSCSRDSAEIRAGKSTHEDSRSAPRRWKKCSRAPTSPPTARAI